MKLYKKILIFLIILGAGLVIYGYSTQILVAHKDERFSPNYEKADLREATDYETIFMQTGLGKAAADKVMKERGYEGLLYYQTTFFQDYEVECVPTFEFWVKKDVITDWVAPKLADLQPGDIIVSLSSHSAGWRHGHAGLVIDEDTILESAIVGTKSDFYSPERWRNYDQYAVLRLKDVTPEFQKELVDYATDTLKGVPYNLFVGMIGKKAPDPDSFLFGVQCSYLPWYAYEHFGYDLDSNGGWFVSSADLLYSPHLEIVQIFGMNPEEFINLPIS